MAGEAILAAIGAVGIGTGVALALHHRRRTPRTVQMSAAWVASRARAVRSAWTSLYGTRAPDHATALALAVAAVEGSGGPHHAWGSVHSRKPSQLELDLLRGGGYTPRGCHAADAQRYLEQQAEAFPQEYGTVGPRTYADRHTEYLACDHLRLGDPSSAYWVWMQAWPDDVLGARSMLSHMHARQVLEDPSSTPDELAKRMKTTYRYATTPRTYADALWPRYRGIRQALDAGAAPGYPRQA